MQNQYKDWLIAAITLLPRLKATVNQLRQEKADLAKISGQLIQKQQECGAIGSAIANLTPQKQDLEQQVAVRNSKLVWVNGQLVHQESKLQELNHQHEQARQKLETLFQQQGVATERLSTLQAELAFITAQLSALNHEVERLKEQKRSLVNVEAQLAVKQAEFA